MPRKPINFKKFTLKRSAEPSTAFCTDKPIKGGTKQKSVAFRGKVKRMTVR